MSYYVTSDQVKIYYEAKGKGKPVIFIHGWCSDHSSYDAAIAVLSSRYQCIALDLRGCGASSRPRTGLSMDKCARDVKELIEYLELTDVTLFGMSLGTSVVYAYIKAFGCQYLNRIIIADMPPRLLDDDSPDHPWHWGLYRGENSKDDLLRNVARMFDDFDEYVLWHMEKCMPAAYGLQGLPEQIRQEIGTENLPDEARGLVARGLCRDLDPLATIALAYSTIYEDYRDVLPKVTIPALVLYPAPGSIYVPEAMEYVAKHLGGPVRKVRFEPGTHMFLLEHAKRSIQEVAQFMEEVFPVVV